MKRVKRSAAPLAVLAVGALLATGCGGTSTSSSAGSSSPGTTAASSSNSGKKFAIGLVPFALADPGSNQILKGLEAVAKANGWSYSVIDAQGTPDKAIAAIQNLVQKKVNVIVTTVFPANSLAAGGLAAKAAGIPIASVGSGTGDGVVANWDVGTQVGKDLGAKVVADTKGIGNLLVLGYSPGLPCRQREAGLDAAIKGTPFKTTRDEVPIPGQVEASAQFTQAWLAAHPQSAGPATIWGCLDDFSAGALSAIKQAGRTGLKVYSINGAPQALEAVRAGTLTATDWVNWYGLGEQIGKAVPTIIKNGVSGAPFEGGAPSVLVDSSNVEAFLKQYPQALTWK
jgi:ABC-type sugar transport system substrate-binding protein